MRKWCSRLGESIIFAWAAVRGAPGCRRAVREGFRSSCWALRRSFWNSRELILDSPKVIVALPRVILCTLESIRSFGCSFPPFCGIISSSRTHFGDNGNDFWAHRTNSELQLLRCSFLKLQVFNDSACQRSSDGLCVLKTSWDIPGGTPLSGSAAVGTAQ